METHTAESIIIKKTVRVFAVFCVFLFAIFLAASADAATLSVGPATGSFTIGSTFDISLFLNTDGEIVNAVAVSVLFPPDKLQLVSPSTGNSIVAIWTTLPNFNNQTGRVDLQGGVPGGINVKNGLITTLTFRVKSVGPAVVKFTDSSKVLLHDGLGTDALRQTLNGVYQLVLPPPAGPIVASETHPDQSQWYRSSNVALQWAPDFEVDGYSHMLNDTPVDLPDDIAEGPKASVIYKNVPDGIKYFHIKALKDGGWGGTTHFAVKVDTTAPAEFPIEVLPGARTTRRQPIIQFDTTDALSGVEHYELKLIPLSAASPSGASASQPLFIEVQSPYVIPPLELGGYDLIIRAYDYAGNHGEVVRRMTIVTPILKFLKDDGIEISNTLIIPWLWVWITALVLFLTLVYLGWRVRVWHYEIEIKRSGRELPEEVTQQLSELQSYRTKYGGAGKALFVLFLLTSVLFGGVVRAAEEAGTTPVEFAPPIVTTVSRDISNEEIFYIGGKTDTANTGVVLYIQNMQTGETVSALLVSDKRGDWFYRHAGFLPSGSYLLWAQSKVGDALSPPSPQVDMTVRPTAIQFGSTRLSRDTLYVGVITVLGAAFLFLILYILFHGYHGHKKYRLFLKEVLEAEQSVRRGFAVLRRDIEAELAVIHKAKLSRALAAEEAEKEKQLMRDLDFVEKYISKEIWDVERVIKTEEKF